MMTSREVLEMLCNSVSVQSVRFWLRYGYFSVVRAQMRIFISISCDVTAFHIKQNYCMGRILAIFSLLLKLWTKIRFQTWETYPVFLTEYFVCNAGFLHKNYSSHHRSYFVKIVYEYPVYILCMYVLSGFDKLNVSDLICFISNISAISVS